MPSILKNFDCLSCGDRHNFVVAVGGLVPGVKYHYVCPHTHKSASLRCGERGHLSTFVPQGTVPLTVASLNKAA